MKFSALILGLCNLILIKSERHSRKYLQVAMFERPPFFFLSTNQTRRHATVLYNKFMNSTLKSNYYVGVTLLTIEWLSKRIDFKYDIIPTKDEVGYVSTVNRTRKLTGALGRLANNEFNLLATPSQLSYTRAEAIDFVSYDIDLSAMITPAPSELSPILSTLRPFNYKVWILMILSLFAVAFCLTFISMSEPVFFQWKKLKSVDSFIFYLLAILVSQGEIFFHKAFRFKLSFRFACATWCLFCVVVLNVYSGTLVSHLTSREMKPSPETLWILFEEGILNYLFVPSSIGLELIADNVLDPQMKVLAELVRQKPDTIVESSDVAFEKVLSGCCAYYDTMTYVEYRAMQDFLYHGKCRVSIGETVSGYALFGMAITKSHPLKENFNHRYLELKQTGLIDYWRQTFTGGRSECYRWLLIRNRRVEKLRSLTTNDLGSAFLLLALGFILSLLTFVIEQSKRYKIWPLLAINKQQTTHD